MLNRIVKTNKFKPESLHVATHGGAITNSIPSQAFLFGENGISKFIRKDSAPLCACGCGERVRKSTNYKGWNKYIFGHGNRGEYYQEEPHNSTAPLCACGCGERVKWDKWKRKWNKYIFCHRGQIKIPPNSEAPLCGCGCSKKTNWCKYRKQWNKFIYGHSQRGKNNNRYGKIGAMAGKYGKEHPMFGYKYTEEQLKIKSESMKGEQNHFYGKSHKIKTRKIISESKKGQKQSIETIEKHRKFMKGRQHALGIIHTFEQRQKWSKERKGNNNPMYGRLGPLSPAWRGGIAAEPYCDIWLDRGYKQSILERDNYTCQNPNCRKSCTHLPLHIHHINNNKKHCDPWNLLTLCNSCNGRAKFNIQHWVIFYQNIMFEKYDYKYE